MPTLPSLARLAPARVTLLVAPLAVFLVLAIATNTALAANNATKFDLGPFQSLFVTIRPLIMVGFLALGLWALIHNFGRTLTGTLKSRPDGAATPEHRASIGRLFELVVVIAVLEGLVYGTLWYGLDLFGAAINLFQQVASTPSAH